MLLHWGRQLTRSICIMGTMPGAYGCSGCIMAWGGTPGGGGAGQGRRGAGDGRVGREVRGREREARLGRGQGREARRGEADGRVHHDALGAVATGDRRAGHLVIRDLHVLSRGLVALRDKARSKK